MTNLSMIILATTVSVLIYRVNALEASNLATKKNLLRLTKVVHRDITGEEYEKDKN